MGRILFMVVVSAVVVCVGCKKEEASPSQRDSGTSKDVQDRRAQLERERQSYIDQSQKKLDESDHQIDELKAKEKDASDAQRAKIQMQIDDLKKKQIDLRENLDKIKSAGVDAWEDLKPRLKGALNDLTRGVTDAISQFRFAEPTPGPGR